jgi:hypothetical protein
MKNFKVLAFTILSIGFIFLNQSCSKLNEKSNKSADLKSIQVDQPIKVHFSCEGDGCSDGGACKATFGGNGWNLFSCCEGCYLVIRYETDGELKPATDKIRNYVSQLDSYYAKAEEFIIGSYSENFVIKEVELVYNEKNYFVMYYFSSDIDEEGSILVYAPIGGDPISVDCTGSCNGTCVENATINPNGTVDVSCGCESDDCKMFIDN